MGQCDLGAPSGAPFLGRGVPWTGRKITYFVFWQRPHPCPLPYKGRGADYRLTKYLPPCEGGGIKKKCINIVGMGKKMLLCRC